MTNALREWRKSRGMTQVELAEFLGVSQPVISGYERGKHSIPAESAREFANKTGLPLYKLRPDLWKRKGRGF